MIDFDVPHYHSVPHSRNYNCRRCEDIDWIDCNFRRVKLKRSVAAVDRIVGRQWIMSLLNVVPFDIGVLLHEMSSVTVLESLRSWVSMCRIDSTIYFAHDLMYSNYFRPSMMADRSD